MFKYILIDEYQDISNQRFLLIKKYVEKVGSKLMCVGDDWQTIFSFAASDINKILHFDSEFVDAKILKILVTYRNSQELINIAGKFVMNNSFQIRKQLKSIKSLKDPIEYIYYKNTDEKIAKIAHKLEELFSLNENFKIALLARYNFELNEILANECFSYMNNELYFKGIKVFFHTIHTSKGLGFDYVFILNNKKGYYGFPARRHNYSIFKGEKVLNEERRLFYVGLTRTKNKVFLVTPNRKVSVFSKEIKKILKKNKYLI